MILYAGNILSSHGYTPTFIETLAPKLSEYYNITSVSDKLSQPLRLMDMVQTFYRLKKNLELVLIDSYSMRAFWFTYALAKLCRNYNIPYAPILRGGGYPERLKSSPSLCREVFGNAYRNISPSLYLKKHFEDAGFEVDYIPNFIPIENYKFKYRSEVGPRLFWVRSFHEIYNPVMALEVLRSLKESYPEAELCMVGPDKDGTQKKFEDEMNEMRLEDSVKITGKLPKNEWSKLSQNYDIFINTTDFDNHPVSVIEAMALGLPVVSTKVGGLPYLIDDGFDGLLVEPRNSQLFSNSVLSLIRDNELAARLSLNARKKVEEFDWEIVKHKWFDMIDPLLKRKEEVNVVS
jgi:glycosyltransferase involved in cell wall biosynthesis